MRKGFDIETVRNVIDRMNVVLRDTVGTKPPINIEEIIALQYPNLKGVVAEVTKAFQPDESRIPFALAMLVADAEFRNQNIRISKDNIILGARYLLMPNDRFVKNVRSLKLNLFELTTAIYTNVTVNDIAYHLVDEGECGVRQFKHGRFKRYCFPEDWNIVSGMGLDKKESEVVKASLASPTKHAYVEISEYMRLEGWVAGEDMVIVLYIKD